MFGLFYYVLYRKDFKYLIIERLVILNFFQNHKIHRPV